MSSILSKALNNSEMGTKIMENTCLLVWDEVVGDHISSASQPDYVQDGKLFVITKSPVWANELSFYKNEIIQNLNKRVGGNVIKEIIFKAGKIKPKKKLKKDGAFSGLKVEDIDLNDDEMEFIKNTASSAREGALELMKLMETAAKLSKWRRLQGWVPCKKCGSLQNNPSGICGECVDGE
jgi:predicted nucleic acid-binding Zn ribbon protein